MTGSATGGECILKRDRKGSVRSTAARRLEVLEQFEEKMPSMMALSHFRQFQRLGPEAYMNQMLRPPPGLDR